jgi:hypothetical protein
MTNRTFKTGLCREQGSFLPPHMDDFVDKDNPVRAIDAYVRSLDLLALGFQLPITSAGERGNRPTIRRTC